MNAADSDLQRFLEVVGKIATSIAENGGSPAHSWSAVESAGLPALARDTADEPDALRWLAHTVRAASEESPALAYLLAARYAADRALGDDRFEAPTIGVRVPGSSFVVPSTPPPDGIVVLDLDEGTAGAVAWSDAAVVQPGEERTGLVEAGLVTLSLPEAMDSARRPEAVADWDILAGAALAGLARGAVRRTAAYVTERRQFGVPVGSFAGLRAFVAEMELRVEAVEALLGESLTGSSPSESVAAAAGRVAVDTCIDAIQAHGGYGYIVEYPLAGLLRDAVSLQARAGGRRMHMVRVAERRLGPITASSRDRQ